jgi:HD-GYP domain-containing protein (c-di-GMP phosphodiesterase class II)
MSNLKLLYHVHTPDNRLLLPAGTVLSEETMDALISSSKDVSHRASSQLLRSSVKKDLVNFISQPPYHVIFADQEQIADLLNLLDSINIVVPVLQSLDYFKQYDLLTYRHILVVSAVSTLLAKELLSDYKGLIQEAAIAPPAHDFGKICVPLQILNKVDPLTRSELSILRHHPVAGYVLLSYYLRDHQSLAVRVARDHHERRDGSGYPRGTRLTDPVVEIVAVADVYDALISSRPYRPVSYDNRTALEEITSMAERNQIGWKVVKALVACNRKSKPHYTECEVSVEKRGVPPPGNVYGVISNEKGHLPDANDNKQFN